MLTVKNFFDSATYTLTYLVFDPMSKDAIIIDPVLNFDYASSKISYESMTELMNTVAELNLSVHYIFETHVHADHLSSAFFIKQKNPEIKVAISSAITKVQETFSGIYNKTDIAKDGSQFDLLINENDEISVGSFKVKALLTPGHTPACMSLLIEDMIFVGDALFMPDFGTGRCDFPDGSAKNLYHSVHEKLYLLPSETKVYTGHDYSPGGRELMFLSTMKEQMENNIQLKKTTSEEEFLEFREARDKTLTAPKLLLPSIQVNMNGGQFTEAESNGVQYLKIPLSWESK